MSGVLLALIVVAIGFVWLARTGRLDPTESVLRARYALPDSRFLAIDGEPIHFVDEGHGPAVVLVHGSYGSLRMWSAWVSALVPRYRVVRFDRPPMGLSGPDPGGHYDPDREAHLIDSLTRSLGIERFYLVGTSSAGMSVTEFAAEHPDRLKGLILSNIGVGPVTPSGDRQPAELKLLRWIDPVFKGWRGAEFWRLVLRSNFADPDKVTPALAREWADLNNRAQFMPLAKDSKPITAYIDSTTGYLRRITVPTLLLWSANDPEVPVDVTAKKGLELLASPDKKLEVVAHCGHMMPIECGAESAPLAVAFLDRLEATGN